MPTQARLGNIQPLSAAGVEQMRSRLAAVDPLGECALVLVGLFTQPCACAAELLGFGVYGL